MAFLVFFIVAGVIGIVVFVASRSRTEPDKSWVQFFAKGKDSGFSFKELELLRRLAVKNDLEDPTALFWSQNQLDRCIRTLVRSTRDGGDEEDMGSQDFLSKLYDFRKKIAMDTPRIKWGISNSRQVSEGQALRILVAGTGVFKSQIVKNTTQYITISRPVSTKVSPSFSWKGLKVSVYFWRQDDAGYVFDSDVIDEVFSERISSLKIAHSDSLFRTQKRKSIRVKVHKPAFLYLMGPNEEPGRIESAPGARCFVEDLSDTGCAVIIGGRANLNWRIKVQFAINNKPVCMSGTIRSVDYKEDVNRSVLHVEADTLPISVRNRILGEVFGLMSDDDEELPFRIIEDQPPGKGGAEKAPNQTAETAPAENRGSAVSPSVAPPPLETQSKESAPAASSFTDAGLPPAPGPSLAATEQEEPALVPLDGEIL
jgi:c-di-GMP-binding flagellar brake protein YcgR